jgi:16S rRNA (guanine(966)-N(2))-methyltransferase RsmD
LRVTAGLYKGRVLKRVESLTTRETADIVKQAVFNMLFDLSNKVFLDVFSGSGQMAIEALSRGASHAYMIESNKEAIMISLENASYIGCQKNITFIERDVFSRFLNDITHKIDIIFMDPPYDFVISEKLFKSLPEASECIIETHKDTKLEDTYLNFKKVKERKYGIKKITYYIT